MTQLVVHNYHWISLHSVLDRSSLVWRVTPHFSPPYTDHWLLAYAWSPATKGFLWMPWCSSNVIQNIFILFFVSTLLLEMVWLRWLLFYPRFWVSDFVGLVNSNTGLFEVNVYVLVFATFYFPFYLFSHFCISSPLNLSLGYHIFLMNRRFKVYLKEYSVCWEVVIDKVDEIITVTHRIDYLTRWGICFIKFSPFFSP